MRQEIIKDIPGYEGDYIISSNGTVLSCKTGNVLSKHIDQDGYCCFGVSSPNKYIRLHRILAEIFLPNPEGKPFINHKNGIKTDFSLDNLEWVTAKENVQHARAVLNLKCRGGINKIISKNSDGNIIAEYKSIREASRITGIPFGSLQKAVSGKRKQTHGLIWSVAA